MDIFGLVPSFGSLAFTILALIVALSVVVAVHEYGHYIVGRWTGIHAEVFSLGFGPVLYSRVDRRGTRWQLAALPLGGFVRFKGDADGASGKDEVTIAALSAAERRRTMHGAPLWARSATVAAGPIFNFLLSMVLFAGVFLVNGVATDLPVVGQLKPTPHTAQSLLSGDRITALNGTATPDLAAFLAAAEALPPSPVVTFEIDRGGQALTVEGPFPLPPIVDGVQPLSAAADVGLQPGDVVLAVDRQPIHSFRELRQLAGDSGGRAMLLTVWRAGETIDIALVPRRMDIPLDAGGFETRWMIGLAGGLVFTPELRHPGPIEVLGLAISETWRIASTSLSGMAHIVTGQISSCNLQGPVGIAEISGAAAKQGFETFVLFLATLSTGIGLLNLFPIPILDGGHLVFHAYEALARRPPSDRALRMLMSVGLALLLSLMVFALGNDLIWC